MEHPNIDAAVLHAARRMESQRSAACQASIDALHAHVEAATLEAAAEAEAAAKTSAEDGARSARHLLCSKYNSTAAAVEADMLRKQMLLLDCKMNSSKEDSHDFHCQAALARLELIHSVTNHGTTAQQMAARDEQLRRSKSQAKKERQAREVLQSQVRRLTNAIKQQNLETAAAAKAVEAAQQQWQGAVQAAEQRCEDLAQQVAAAEARVGAEAARLQRASRERDEARAAAEEAATAAAEERARVAAERLKLAQRERDYARALAEEQAKAARALAEAAAQERETAAAQRARMAAQERDHARALAEAQAKLSRALAEEQARAAAEERARVAAQRAELAQQERELSRALAEQRAEAARRAAMEPPSPKETENHPAASEVQRPAADGEAGGGGEREKRGSEPSRVAEPEPEAAGRPAEAPPEPATAEGIELSPSQLLSGGGTLEIMPPRSSVPPGRQHLRPKTPASRHKGARPARATAAAAAAAALPSPSPSPPAVGGDFDLPELSPMKERPARAAEAAEAKPKAAAGKTQRKRGRPRGATKASAGAPANPATGATAKPTGAAPAPSQPPRASSPGKRAHKKPAPGSEGEPAAAGGDKAAGGDAGEGEMGAASHGPTAAPPPAAGPAAAGGAAPGVSAAGARHDAAAALAQRAPDKPKEAEGRAAPSGDAKGAAQASKPPAVAAKCSPLKSLTNKFIQGVAGHKAKLGKPTRKRALLVQPSGAPGGKGGTADRVPESMLFGKGFKVPRLLDKTPAQSGQP
eukprot:jgi/Tetstr1/442983/TSEL_031043.t1